MILAEDNQLLFIAAVDDMMFRIFATDDELICNDCRIAHERWAEEAPNFRLCVDCANERIAEEDHYADK